MENKTVKKLQLNYEHVQHLIMLPESGMGYQLVNITLKDGRKLNKRIVLDSRLLLLKRGEELDPSDIDKIELANNGK